jgi:hypothetical protein
VKTPEEVRKEMYRIATRTSEQQKRIIEHCRHLIPTLKDRGAPAAAEELAALYFVLEALDGELTQLVLDNPDASIEAMLRDLRKGLR